MLIECTIKRPGGSHVELFGHTYHFAPRADGAHVCEVDDDRAAERLVMEIPEGYRVADPEGPPAEDVLPPTRSIYAPLEPVDKLIPKLEDLDDDELRQKGRELGLKFPPRMRGETMRKNLLLRYREMMDPDDGDPAAAAPVETPVEE
jgi:hypothetical protein